MAEFTTLGNGLLGLMIQLQKSYRSLPSAEHCNIETCENKELYLQPEGFVENWRPVFGLSSSGHAPLSVAQMWSHYIDFNKR